MRKEADMRKEDLLEVSYQCAADSMLARVIREQSAYITSRLGRTLIPSADRPSRAVCLLRTEADTRVVTHQAGKLVQATEPLVLELLAGCPFVDHAALAKAVPDEDLRDGVISYLHCLSLDRLRDDVKAGNKTLKVLLNDASVDLSVGAHVFLTYADLLASRK
eukprot:scaffold105693_cov32-Tisochrysis_lutea.AAC.3